MSVQEPFTTTSDSNEKYKCKVCGLMVNPNNTDLHFCE